MLSIPEGYIENIISLAKDNFPEEVCGVITAEVDSNIPNRFIAMRNAARSDSFFQFDPNEQLKVWRDMDAHNESPFIIFHTHTDSIAYPSKTDIQLASEPDAHYLIVSTDDGVKDKCRSFRIMNGKVVEENLRIVKDHIA